MSSNENGTAGSSGASGSPNRTAAHLAMARQSLPDHGDCDVLRCVQRVLGTGAASAWLRVASALGPAIVRFTISAYGVATVFLLFGVISLAGAGVTMGATETRERALEEISP